MWAGRLACKLRLNFKNSLIGGVNAQSSANGVSLGVHESASWTSSSEKFPIQSRHQAERFKDRAEDLLALVARTFSHLQIGHAFMYHRCDFDRCMQVYMSANACDYDCTVDKYPEDHFAAHVTQVSMAK